MMSTTLHRLGAFAIVAAGLAAGQSADAAVLAHWSFDETSGTSYADSSGNGYTGTAQGAGVTHVAGEFGDAANFNGASSSWIKTPYVGGFQSSSFTMSAWVDVSASAINTIFSDWSSPFSFRLYVDTDSKLTLQMRNTSGTDIFTDGLAKSTTTISNNTWHMVTAAWDRTSSSTGTVTFYIDGVAAGSVNSSSANINVMNLTGHNYGIGLKQDGANRFNGSIDELWVLNSALSATQVNSLYLSNAIPEPAAAGILGLGGLLAVIRRRR